MKKLGVYFIGLILLATTSVLSARIVCWTNKDGIRECGDKIPPEYSQHGHQELNPQGIVVEETEAAKSDAELEELKRIAAERAREERMAEKQRRRDRMLLDTFSSVKDIERARDNKIEAIDMLISLAERRITKLKQDKDRLIRRAARIERAGNPPPEQIIKDISSIDQQIKDNNQYIATKRKEQKEIRLRHNQDIARFKEIKPLTY